MITILLVEDNVAVRRGLRRLLEAKGDIKVVATAANGRKGVTSARKLCPDVAVVDISLPVMDGIEAAAAEAYLGSSGFAVKRTRFGDESVRTHALIPKSGYLPRKFPESPYLDQNAGND